MDFLKETDLLKIEDILPFFPDFVLIDHFKDQICHALEEYNQHIDELKQDMDEATRSAEAIRLDIRELRNKCGARARVPRCSLVFCLVLPFFLAAQVGHRRCQRQVQSLHAPAADAAILPLPLPALFPCRLPDD